MSNIVDFHKCNFECERPECLKKQRDELTNKVKDLTLINLKLIELLKDSVHYKVRKIL